MTRRLSSSAGFVVACVAVASSAFAQPTYINLGRITGGDLSDDGNAVVGSVLDSSIDEGLITIWRRGMGPEFSPAGFAEGAILASDDLSAFAMSKENLDNWGNLNCFLGNEVAPQSPPCTLRDIAHHWTMATGWVNAGSFERTQETVDYSCNGAPLAPVNVWVGGTRCDFTINAPNDISGDGRYVVGGGWLATNEPRSNGCAPTGICGDFRAFRYDAMTQSFEMLPFEPGSSASRADKVNGNGGLVVGYDSGMSADPDGGGPLPGYNGRRLAIWRDAVEEILDPYGNQDGAPVTRDGTQVVGRISTTLSELEFGPNPDPSGNPGYINLAKWTWDGMDWNVSLIGRPDDFIRDDGMSMTLADIAASAVSDDGNTVVGLASYFPGPPPWSPFQRDVRAFIWRPSINGGQPMRLAAYIESQLPMGDTTFDSIRISTPRQVSADGNSILVDITDDASPCLSTFADALIDLNGAACEPPQQNVPLVSLAQTTTSSFGAIVNCFVSGTGPLEYQWQKKDLATGDWVDLTNDSFCDTSSFFAYRGTSASQLRIGLNAGFFPCDGQSGDYRCVVTNACGSIATDSAHVTIAPTAISGGCFLVPGDMNDDFITDTLDIPNFVASLLCKPFPDPAFAVDRADINYDGKKDGLDIQEFVNAVVP